MLWTTASLVLYCLPILGVLALRAQPNRARWDIASDVALSMAGDLLLVLLLAHFLTLEQAAFATRAMYLVVSVAFLSRRLSNGKWAWPRPDCGFFVVALLAISFAVLLGAQLSLRCAIWDREWHIPLVSAMRGQHTPFWNVYEQHGQLYYHYAGNALAAMIQSLSFGHLHASVALSLAHEVAFGAIGLFLACALSVVNLTRLVPILGVIAAVLLAGPATALWEGPSRPDDGYSLVNLLSLSFRPHVAIAYLWVLAFALAALLPLLSRGVVRARSTRPLLFVMTSILVMTDESSLMVLGVFLGVLWLCAPQTLSEKRLGGLLVLGGLVTTILATVWLLGGTLSASGVSQKFEWVSPAVPGYYKASLGLHTYPGIGILLGDYLLPLSVWVAGLFSVVSAPNSRLVALFVGYSAVTLVSLGLLCTLQINGSGTESHRFVTALMVLSPVFGIVWLQEAGRDLRVDRSTLIAAAIAGTGTMFCAVSTVQWVRSTAVRVCVGIKGYFGDGLFYTTDCVERYGVGVGAGDHPAYVSSAIWFDYAGCHPLRAPGPDHQSHGHKLVIGLPLLGWPGFAKLDRWLSDSEDLGVVCPLSPTPSDPVCQALANNASGCSVIGPGVQRCTVSKLERTELLESTKR